MITDVKTEPVFHALKQAPVSLGICPLRTIAYPMGGMGQRECLGNQCAWWLDGRKSCSFVVLAMAADEEIVMTERQESRDDLAESVRIYGSEP